RALSAPIIFGAMVRRKVSAAASHPPTRASPQVTNNARISPAISPTTMTAAARRMEVACLPSHLWYKVGAGPLLIVRVFPIAAAGSPTGRAPGSASRWSHRSESAYALPDGRQPHFGRPSAVGEIAVFPRGHPLLIEKPDPALRGRPGNLRPLRLLDTATFNSGSEAQGGGDYGTDKL